MTAHSDPPACIGVVVHPERDIEEPLDALRGWCEDHDSGLGQIAIAGQGREIADAVAVEDCQLIVSIGGDGTTLAAIHAAGADRLVLGVTCGSLGALTTVPGDALPRALDRFVAGDWLVRELPALDIRHDDGEPVLAINDIVLARGGQGQLRLTVSVDGVLFGRMAGDGLIVSTAVGSAAYTLAARGPLVAPGADAFVLTPLPTHGGSLPPLVLGSESRVEIVVVRTGFGGLRVELDGQEHPAEPSELQITLSPGQARLVSFADDEPLFTGLRRRGIIADSPRLVAEDARHP